MLQAEPFQCSIRVTGGKWGFCWLRAKPTAQTSFADMTATSESEFQSLPATLGLSTSRQAGPHVGVAVEVRVPVAVEVVVNVRVGVRVKVLVVVGVLVAVAVLVR